MIEIGVGITTRGIAKVLPRVHRKIMRECNRRTMAHRFTEMLPRHFAPGAGFIYRYEARTSSINLAWLYRSDRAAWERVPKIQSRKLDRKTGKWSPGKITNRGRYQNVKNVLGLEPLVWTGLLRKSVLDRANLAQIRATPSRATLAIRKPSYATSSIKDLGYRLQKQGQALQRNSEIEAINKGEVEDLKRFFASEYRGILRNPMDPAHSFLSEEQAAGRVLRTRKRFGR